MATRPFALQAPEHIALKYGGDKQKIAHAIQMGMIDQTSGVMAGMFIDKMRAAAMAERKPQQTVAQQVLAPPQAQAPPPPQGGPGGPPQGGPGGGLGALPPGGGPPPGGPAPAGMVPQGGVPPGPPQGGPPAMGGPPPQGMAGGGLLSADIPESMFNYSGGGIVAFAGYDDPQVPEPYSETARARARRLAFARGEQATPLPDVPQIAPPQAAPDYSGASTSTPFYQSPVGKALGASDPALLQQAIQNKQIDTDVGLHDFGRKALNLLNTPFGGTKTAAVTPEAQRAAAKERLGFNASAAKPASVTADKTKIAAATPPAAVKPTAGIGALPGSPEFAAKAKALDDASAARVKARAAAATPTIKALGGGSSSRSSSDYSKTHPKIGANPDAHPAVQALQDVTPKTAAGKTLVEIATAPYDKEQADYDKMSGIDTKSIDDAMAEVKKTPEKIAAQKKQDMWQTLAEIGFSMMGTKRADFLGAVGEAGTAAMPAMAERTKERRQDEKDARKEMIDLVGKKNALAAARMEGVLAMRNTIVSASKDDRDTEIKMDQFAKELGLNRDKLAEEIRAHDQDFSAKMAEVAVHREAARAKGAAGGTGMTKLDANYWGLFNMKKAQGVSDDEAATFASNHWKRDPYSQAENSDDDMAGGGGGGGGYGSLPSWARSAPITRVTPGTR
jgi:hypothetical protein